jgi:hypothetical protein
LQSRSRKEHYQFGGAKTGAATGCWFSHHPNIDNPPILNIKFGAGALRSIIIIGGARAEDATGCSSGYGSNSSGSNSSGSNGSGSNGSGSDSKLDVQYRWIIKKCHTLEDVDKTMVKSKLIYY